MDRAREIAARTPPQRNRYVDLLRALSITVVVLGHWLIAVIRVEDGRIVAGHLLAEAPWTQWLTWALQVMPVFFIVGGYSNAASWSATLRKGGSYADWLRGRCQRLLGPTAVFALFWVPLALVAPRVVPDTQMLEHTGRFVAVPLWFLAVYLLVVPVAPVMYALHRRLGAWVPLAFTVLAALVDVLDGGPRIKGGELGPSIGWINYAFVWLAVHQLGMLWWDGRLSRSPAIRWWLAAAGIAGLVGLTVFGPYPVSLIGVPGAERTNNTPPSVVLVFLAAFQMGAILLSERRANRLLQRTDAWARTIVANGMIMTMYLWHLTALVLAVVCGLLLRLRFDIEPLSGAWWLSRLAYVAVLAVALAVFVAAFGRFERPAPPRPVGGGPVAGLVTGAGALLAGAGLAGLAVGGFYAPEGPWGVPALTLLLLLAGSVAVGVRPAIYRRARAGRGAR